MCHTETADSCKVDYMVGRGRGSSKGSSTWHLSSQGRPILLDARRHGDRHGAHLCGIFVCGWCALPGLSKRTSGLLLKHQADRGEDTYALPGTQCCAGQHNAW